jgi:hypothetical protein
LPGVESEQRKADIRGISKLEGELPREDGRIEFVTVERHEGCWNLKEETEGKEIREEQQKLSPGFDSS